VEISVISGKTLFLVIVMDRSAYKLVHEQLVPRKLEEVFSFFARAENLQTLTPKWLNFRILSVDPQPMREGTRISYALRVHGISLRWTSEIVEWDPPHAFVDVQIRGPYKLWRHTHRFAAQGESTRITDEVQYALPFGILGRIAHRFLVRSDVEKIFAYRQERINALFG
jgi:ligand-binding SRPBCC domain-containing protein